MMSSDCFYNLVEPDGQTVTIFLTNPEIPVRLNIFHCSFPKETMASDLIQYFSSNGKVRIKWIDDTSAYLLFDEFPNSTPRSNETFTVLSFGEYHEGKGSENSKHF